ncbi:MAG: hypothetical protein KatS3mg105_4855 [Gemmatales bacterium]|nr:MAG: hypothetical protein KatS3mg105_4855 [Gemmatales bacterium]
MNRQRGLMLLVMLAGFWTIESSQADSIWERRDWRTSHVFNDNRARRVGDILTIVIRETTVFDGKEDRKLKKQTKLSAFWNLMANTAAGGTERSFDGTFDTQSNSLRQFDGKADYKSNRVLTDRITVKVVGVMNNGNLIIEGFRTRNIAGERKVMHVRGIVRPIDIGADNVVESQFIGNLMISYVGRGSETVYLRPGWLGRLMHFFWPY